MERLPDLRPPLSRTLDLTLEVLRCEPVALALSGHLTRLASVYKDCPEEAIFVRLPFSGGHVDGWYRPQDEEFEPTGLWEQSQTA